MSLKTELILVFPSKYADFEGVIDSKQTMEYLEQWRDKLCFMPRYMAEEWPEWKQLIPYILVTDGEKYFVTKRTNKGGEERLHNLYSLGIGGHIDIWDSIYGLMDEIEFPAYAAIPVGTYREFTEELLIDEGSIQHGDFEILGLLNDNSSEVSRVHIALVTRVIVPDRKVRVRENDKLIGQWMTLREIGEVYEDLESWSQIVYDEMIFDTEEA